MQSVNDRDEFGECWICADPDDHGGYTHADATGDGITRYDIITWLDGRDFRPVVHA